MAKYIAPENLRPITYDFTSKDYTSEYGLLRGHYLDDSSDYETEYVKQLQNDTKKQPNTDAVKRT